MEDKCSELCRGMLGCGGPVSVPCLRPLTEYKSLALRRIPTTTSCNHVQSGGDKNETAGCLLSKRLKWPKSNIFVFPEDFINPAGFWVWSTGRSSRLVDSFVVSPACFPGWMSSVHQPELSPVGSRTLDPSCHRSRWHTSRFHILSLFYSPMGSEFSFEAELKSNLNQSEAEQPSLVLLLFSSLSPRRHEDLLY